MVEENSQVGNSELLEAYQTFTNPLIANSLLYNGIKLILENLKTMEERLIKIEAKLYGSVQ
jgi:hypothetical protein